MTLQGCQLPGVCPQIEPEGIPGLGRSGFLILKCKWTLVRRVTIALPPYFPIPFFLHGAQLWQSGTLRGFVHSRTFGWPKEADSWMVSLLPSQASSSMAGLSRDGDQSPGKSRTVVRPASQYPTWSLCPKHPLQ